MQTIAIGILNWNGWQATVECATTILCLHIPAHTQVKLLLCDNGSEDDSLTHITAWANAHLHPTNHRIMLTVLQNKHNLGYAGGMNTIIRYALKNFKLDFIWLLNNDTRVEANALERLIACAEQRLDVVLWGSTICDSSNPPLVKSAGGYRYNSWLTNYRAVGAGNTLATVQAWPAIPHFDYVDGAALFIRCGVINSLGLLNEDYFLYFEELDYARRINRLGWSIGWCPNSIVYHQGGVSTQQLATKATRDPRRTASYHADLSTFKFTWNHHRNILWIAMAARIGGRLAKILLAQEWFLIRSLWYACKDFWRWRFEQAKLVSNTKASVP